MKIKNLQLIISGNGGAPTEGLEIAEFLEQSDAFFEMNNGPDINLEEWTPANVEVWVGGIRPIDIAATSTQELAALILDTWQATMKDPGHFYEDID